MGQLYKKGEKIWWDKFDSNGQKIGSYRSELIGENWPFKRSKICPRCGKAWEYSLKIDKEGCKHDYA